MAETLQSYLVNLGFHVDEVTNTRFLASLLRTEKTIMGIGWAAAAAAIAVGVSVEKIAQHYESLFYLSRRTNESVGSLQAFGFAAKQIGLDSDTAKAAVDRLSLAMRLQPGLAPMLRGLGIDPNEKPSKILDRLAELQSKGRMPFYIGAQIAQMLGMDPQTFLMMVQGLSELRKAEKDFADTQRRMGVDPEKLANESRQLMVDINTLIATADSFFESWLQNFVEPTDKVVKALTNILNMWGGKSPGMAAQAEPAPGQAPNNRSGAGFGVMRMPGTSGMDPEFAENLARMRAAMPPELGGFRIESGFRTRQEQALLYARKPWLAAPPGTSPHERGRAGDIEASDEALAWMHQHAGEFKMRFPMMGGRGHKYEPWHIEPMGSGGGAKTINNNIHSEIHVDGTGDPKQVAGLVLDGQRRLWGDVVRNMSGVIDT